MRTKAHQTTPEAPSTSSSDSTGTAPDPFAELTEYHDKSFARVMLWYFTRKIAQELDVTPTKTGYDGFVEVSKAIMRGRTPLQQKETVLNVLNSLLPSFIPWMGRTFFRPTDLACITCAYFAQLGFRWLVGDMELEEQEVTLPDGSVKMRRSTVHIKKCRYLEQSGCVGLCVNMCKVPTQQFFAEDFGMPLYMEPNFEDLSCKMKFGQAAPPIEEDPVSLQPCFSHCSIAKGKNLKKCKKLTSEAV